MSPPLTQHQVEIQRNLQSWHRKKLLQKVYAEFYQRLRALIDDGVPGRVVEIGAGIGKLKGQLPKAVCTDLFANPWLDLVCDGYELPFQSGSVSHLVLVDVFHHLQAPRAFLREARRVLARRGRLILLEPYISWLSLPIYGLLHHEPIGWRKPIEPSEQCPASRGYYAAQGNATRLFFLRQEPVLLNGWVIFHAEAIASFAYLLSGGFSKPALAPAPWFPLLRKGDAWFTRWPRLFAARCFVGLRLDQEKNRGETKSG